MLDDPTLEAVIEPYQGALVTVVVTVTVSCVAASGTIVRIRVTAVPGSRSELVT